MILDRTTASLQIVLGEAKVTADCDIVACYATTLGAAFSVGMTQTASNGATPVTAVSAPASGAQCQVSEVRLFNNDSVTHVVTLQLLSGVATRVIRSASVAPGGAFTYTPQVGAGGGSDASGGSSGGVSYTLTTGAVGSLNLSTLPTTNPGGGKAWLSGGGSYLTVGTAVAADPVTLLATDKVPITRSGTAALYAATLVEVATYCAYTLPTASTSVLGGVKVDGTTITVTGGVISAPPSVYTLPTASTSVLGGVKVDGSTVTISGGVISAAAGYVLPTASSSVLGGVKVDGSTITISGGGVISAAPPAITGISPMQAYLGQL